MLLKQRRPIGGLSTLMLRLFSEQLLRYTFLMIAESARRVPVRASY